jgi:hypothetical protein
MHLQPAWPLAGFLALHLGAIACAVGTRVAAGSRFELVFQFLFLPALGGVGVATWYGHAAELGIGIPSGITLIAMVLLAVTDLRRTHEPTHQHSLALHR